MQQYKTQYGTIFAVREYKGHPAIMLRAEHKPDDWSLSSMIEPFTPGAWTVEELQAQLDNWAAVQGWTPVEEPASAEPPETADEGREPEDGCPYLQPLENSRKYTCQCSICGDKFTNREICNKSYLSCGWYLDRQDKETQEDTPAMNACQCQTCKNESCFAHGCTKECPANAGESCMTTSCPEYSATEKEDAPCNTEPPAPTGAAAATTDGSAAVSTAETTTTSESGAAANSCGTPAPAAQPSNEPPAELAPTAPASLPAFDYSGLDAQTVQDLHLAEREFAGGKRMAEIGLRRMADGVAIAHDALCGACDKMSQAHNNQHSEKTFGRWCDSVGLNRKAAERLLQVSKLFDNSTPREQKVLEELGPSLLYAAAKPSAPAELVRAVKDGDITTNKQYQEALAEIRARDAKITDLLEMSEAADRRAEEEARKRKEANEGYTAAMDTLRQAQEDAADADARARSAENRAAGAQKLADQRGTENAELKAKLRELESRPVEVAVAQPDENQIEAWRKEGEARILATAKDLAGKARQAQQQAECHASDLEDENNRLRDALNRTGQLDQSAAMACGACSAALGAWFESTARDVPADLGPALTRMKRLRAGRSGR